jgi:hypothetical protein
VCNHWRTGLATGEGEWTGADKNFSSKNSAYVPITTPKVTQEHQSPRQRSYGSTTSPRNDSLKHTRKHWRRSKGTEKLGKFLRTSRTVRLAAADCPPRWGGLSGRQTQTVCSTKETSSRKPTVLSKQSAERSATPRGLSASRGLSAKNAQTVRGRTTQKTANSQEHLHKVVPGSPKRLKLLSQDLREMICVTRWCYAPNLLASNSLERRESRITRTQPRTKNSTQRPRGGFPAFEGSRSSTKRHKHSPMIPSKKSEEKPSQIRGINRRTETPKRHQKDPRKSQLWIFYTTKKDSYKVKLASSTSIPLSRSYHEALKLVLWKF